MKKIAFFGVAIAAASMVAACGPGPQRRVAYQPRPQQVIVHHQAQPQVVHVVHGAPSYRGAGYGSSYRGVPARPVRCRDARGRFTRC